MFEQFEIENGLIIGNRNSMEMKVEGMISNIDKIYNNLTVIKTVIKFEDIYDISFV